ncbi:MAG: hypothetical protein LC776_02355 [Acidobacteria bacterium]|nr:hypothetical protein [Acidobacteriota bacterium]
MRKKISGKDALIVALKELDGNMAAAARRFHCSRTTVWEYVNEDPELRQLVNELSEAFTDQAEQTLFKAIREGNIVATIFYLKTRARDRGYSERLELVPLTTRDIEVELGAATIDTTNQAEALDGNAPAIALLDQ